MTKQFTEEEQREKHRLYSKKHYHENKEYYKKWVEQNRVSRILSAAKDRAKKRGLEFSITKADVVLPEFCPILGIKLEFNSGQGHGGKDSSHSLDRIDNSKGYVKGNIQIISHKANSMKFTASQEELELFANWILRNKE